ncbi:MAG: LytR/AlgR family response regulator transcription factor [Flavobacteriales bacterium]
MNRKSISCLIVDDEPIAREILVSHLQKIPFISIIGTCKNAEEALNLIQKKKIDLMLLDINMPGMSGMSLAKSIKDIHVIFTTAYREFAIEGFEVQAVDYLLKPIGFDRLFGALLKFSEQHTSSETIEKNYIFIRSERKMKRVDFDDIKFVERIRDQLHIHLSNNILVTRENLDELEKHLPTSCFIRIHRSFIVSINKIDAFTNEHIEIGNKTLPISRSYRQIVLQILN